MLALLFISSDSYSASSFCDSVGRRCGEVYGNGLLCTSNLVSQSNKNESLLAFLYTFRQLKSLKTKSYLFFLEYDLFQQRAQINHHPPAMKGHTFECLKFSSIVGVAGSQHPAKKQQHRLRRSKTGEFRVIPCFCLFQTLNV